MTNEQLASQFDEMADLLELAGENVFRVRAYRNGAMAIRNMTDSVADLISKGADLTTVDGIGSTLAEKTAVLVTIGSLPQLEKLRVEVPPTLRDVMKVPSLGAKKAMKLFQELGIKDLAELRHACEQGAIASLKGFGEKTQQSILQNIDLVEKASQRLSLESADLLAERLRAHMVSCAAVGKLEFAGSYRRGKETIGDLDMLVTSDRADEVMNRFAEFPSIGEVLQRGDTKMSVRVHDAFQIDLRVVPDESWGAALQYFTGSKEHNVRIRGMAKSKGWKVNEYGVFDSSDESKMIAGSSEEEIYRLLGMPYIPPELRECRLEFDLNHQASLDQLIQLSDLRGDLHMHTDATDGECTLEQMRDAAKARGLEYIAITDHSKRVSIARGLNDEQALEQWKRIDELNSKADGSIWIFKGIECDILEDGPLDLSDDCLSHADWVTASIHFGQRQSREQITDRIISAIRNPNVHSISHPTGRLISRRQPYDVDLAAVIQAAKEYGKCLELNANPERLDLNDLNSSAAAEAGVMIVINTDAHSIANMNLMKFGVAQARRAGLLRAQVLNTRSLQEFREWLASR